MTAPHNSDEPSVLVRLPADVLAALDRGCAGRSRASVLRGIVADAVCPPPSAEAQAAAMRAKLDPRSQYKDLRQALAAAHEDGLEEHGPGALSSGAMSGITILLRRGATYALLWRTTTGWARTEVGA